MTAPLDMVGIRFATNALGVAARARAGVLGQRDQVRLARQALRLNNPDLRHITGTFLDQALNLPQTAGARFGDALTQWLARHRPDGSGGSGGSGGSDGSGIADALAAAPPAFLTRCGTGAPDGHRPAKQGAL